MVGCLHYEGNAFSVGGFMYRRLSMAVILGFAAISVLAFAGSDKAAAAKACTKEYVPVCGLSRSGEHITYGNACQARAARAKILHPGGCLGPICVLAILVYDPVCARDPRGFPRTYSSMCEAENANAVFIRKGTCK
jgi:Kazal-type serine protease inhibitor domain